MPTSPTPLYDDTYAGPRWRYGLRYRPLGYAQVPNGWIIFSDRPHPAYHFGTVEYSRPLTTHEEEQFSLILLAQVASPAS